MDDHQTAVATAFSRKAGQYDAFGADHINLDRMRWRVYDHISRVMPVGGRLLEINAGTGLDAVALARLGYRVHATDLSDAMVAQIRDKIARQELADRLTAQQLSFTHLDAIDGPFDGVVSNFGGLNCVADLTAVISRLPRLLAPRGRVTVVIMPPICPWELAVIPKDPRVGTRRLRGRVEANVEGVDFETTYHAVRDTIAAFGPRFRRVSLEGLSIITPPADNKTFAGHHPRLYRSLVAIEKTIAHVPPFRSWGDFYILTMEADR